MCARPPTPEDDPDAIAPPPDPRGLPLARYCAQLAEARKAGDIVVLYVEKLIGITDYFVIMTGRSARHCHAIADELVAKAKHAGVKHVQRDAHGRSRWTLVDLGTVVVHIFQEDARRFYDLELLWGDADRVAW